MIRAQTSAHAPYRLPVHVQATVPAQRIGELELIAMHLGEADACMPVHLAIHVLHLVRRSKISLRTEEHPPLEPCAGEYPRVCATPVALDRHARLTVFSIFAWPRVDAGAAEGSAYRPGRAPCEDAEQIRAGRRAGVEHLPIPARVERPWIPHGHPTPALVVGDVLGAHGAVVTEIHLRIQAGARVRFAIDPTIGLVTVLSGARVMAAVAGVGGVDGFVDVERIRQVHVRIFLEQNRRLACLDGDGRRVEPGPGRSDLLLAVDVCGPIEPIRHLDDDFERSLLEEPHSRDARAIGPDV